MSCSRVVDPNIRTTHLKTDHWQFLLGRPDQEADVKLTEEDFVVREVLGYEPIGEGEHIYVWLRKKGLNTAFVAEQLASFCQLPLRAISYAGRKDKHAVTEQWFGIHKPGKAEYDWHKFALAGAEILSTVRHNKKLRTGVLKSNQFELNLRNLSGTAGLEQRLRQIQVGGVPNYFGQQRFGESRYHQSGGNLLLAEKMLSGEVIRNRNKRSMAISAMRAWLFNEFVSARLTNGQFSEPMKGDVFNLQGSNSFFVSEEIDDTLLHRMADGDIAITAPMWGEGNLASENLAMQFERQMAANHSAPCQLLEQLGLRQERRSILLRPRNMTWEITADNLALSFELPPGCFATSVIREIIHPRSVENTE